MSAAVSYALVVSEYPTVSHAFVEREVAAARALGARVATFSVRPARPAQVRSVAARREFDATTNLLGRPSSYYLRVHARLLLRRPRAWAAGLGAALGRGPRSPRGRLWQVFYFVEAGVLVAEMRRLGLRHVHAHLANSGADVARTAADLGSRVYDGPPWSWSFAMHGPTEFENVDAFDLAGKVRSAAFVACISDFCRSQLMRQVEPEHWSDLHLVRMGVDTDRYRAAAELRRDREGAATRVLFVGRLVAEKGPALLLEALATVVAHGVPVDAVVVGDGPLRAALEKQIDRLGLTGSVRLVGAVGQDELPAWYEWADVFCLPSFAEGVPVVLMEAMSTELPVVTTRITGIPELVGDGESGRLVTPGRVGELAEALCEIARGGLEIEAWGIRGREKVAADFDPAVHAATLVRLIDEATR